MHVHKHINEIYQQLSAVGKRLKAVTVKVKILAHINILLNFNNVTCFSFHDLDIFSIELHIK